MRAAERRCCAVSTVLLTSCARSTGRRSSTILPFMTRADVEQVVHQARRGVATWRSMMPRRAAARRPCAERRMSSTCSGGRDRRQRIAQLVAEHREELVLGLVGELRSEPRILFEQPRLPLAMEQLVALDMRGEQREHRLANLRQVGLRQHRRLAARDGSGGAFELAHWTRHGAPREESCAEAEHDRHEDRAAEHQVRANDRPIDGVGRNADRC